jgi:hypothetical protein
VPGSCSGTPRKPLTGYGREEQREQHEETVGAAHFGGDYRFDL